MKTDKLKETLKTNVYATVQQKTQQAADFWKSNFSKEAINKTIEAAKNSAVITKAKNALDPANIKAAAAETYENVVKTPIAKTQAALKAKKEQLLDMPLPNFGLSQVPLGPTTNMTVREGIEAAKDTVMQAVGKQDSGGERKNNRDNVVDIAHELLDDYTNSVRDGSRYGMNFKPSVTSVAVDSTDSSRAGFGSSGIYQKNPSIESVEFDTPNDYIDFYKHRLSDEYIDELVSNNQLRFDGTNIETIKNEMGKLRELIQNTKDIAASKGKFYNNDRMSEPSMQKNWLVENCAEIWAVRDAILQGAKIENLVLRSVSVDTGLVKPFCKNCKLTFGEFMQAMD